MKNILVPLDFSEHANFAFNAAVKLSKKHNSVIHLLQSIKSIADAVQVGTFSSGNFAASSVSADQVLALLDLKTNQAKNTLDEYKQKAESQYCNVICHVLQSSISDSVNSICDEHNIDLIIMGSHGVSGISEMLIGSNAQKVVRNTRVSCLNS
jgi:nucleotide-binding universal stress UspA family protein|tara:strand:- start:526 stop:984 length:459 start_codon:yes stop_codon:yes gene_type:complete